jgi:hypothetical protein
MNRTNGKNDLEAKLIANMPLGRVVLIDNAPYHTVQGNYCNVSPQK